MLPAGTSTSPNDTAYNIMRALIAAGAFALYWLSSLLLHARGATTHFGADAHLFGLLANGTIVDGVARFHPVTVGIALAWLKVVGPLTMWVSPHTLLKILFAATGAAGVWAATVAFAAAIPGRTGLLGGVTYALSFGVWYFSSIEESKIVAATLTAFYIASYLHLRKHWTTRGALLLSGILLLACLDEIVAGFLVVIPFVDTLMQRGGRWRNFTWIVTHSLAAPLAFLILEGVINGPVVAAGNDPARTSLLGMLSFYLHKNNYGLAALYGFGLNWLFFNIAAPTPYASYATPSWGNFKGYFEPAFSSYFTAPVSAGVIVAACAIVLVISLPRFRSPIAADMRNLLLALAAFVVLRAAFFFVFNPEEPLLFSPAITLALLLAIGVPFASSQLSCKCALLTAFIVCLGAANGAFIIGR